MEKESIERRVNKRIFLDLRTVMNRVESVESRKYRGAVVCVSDDTRLRGGTVLREVIGKKSRGSRQTTTSRDVAEIRAKLGVKRWNA